MDRRAQNQIIHFLCYSKTIVKFKKTSGSAPEFLYFTVHYDGVNGDFHVYPTNWPNKVYMVAYGVDGLTDIVDTKQKWKCLFHLI